MNDASQTLAEKVYAELIEFRNFLEVEDPLRENLSKTTLQIFLEQYHPAGILRKATTTLVAAPREAQVWSIGNETVDDQTFHLAIEPDGEMYFSVLTVGYKQPFHSESYVIDVDYLSQRHNWELELILKFIQVKRDDYAAEQRSREAIASGYQAIDDHYDRLQRLTAPPLDREGWAKVAHMFPGYAG